MNEELRIAQDDYVKALREFRDELHAANRELRLASRNIENVLNDSHLRAALTMIETDIHFRNLLNGK